MTHFIVVLSSVTSTLKCCGRLRVVGLLVGFGVRILLMVAKLRKSW